MIVLEGSSALSPQNVISLLNKSNQILPNLTISHLSASYLHFIDTTSQDAHQDLNSPQSYKRKILDALLVYGEKVELRVVDSPSPTPSVVHVFVVPRLGTISPWSSKATDISRICNLGDVVARIERGIRFTFQLASHSSSVDFSPLLPLLYDRMTQTATFSMPSSAQIFSHPTPGPLHRISLTPSNSPDSISSPLERLQAANQSLGLALSPPELSYLLEAYVERMKRDPTDVELFMFAQVNSEHCRHKIFNAHWTVDGEERDLSLFAMIRNTEKLNPHGYVSSSSF